ncbi:hypothetical protein K431DRAFT_308181 [Polychaeton citri CBS 116435]|uniref:Spindle pole body component n=1 Tax=Polychaeton citri CBS 116435 TaxID=1314669 RepID=A0A9P4UK53_9PEZI|nr:hypothetical protein K431DRAFT_308181 [Polychaeton citri CBS 116435]
MSQPPHRSTSIAERRAAAAVKQRATRPTSASVSSPRDHEPDQHDKAAPFSRKSTETTTTATTSVATARGLTRQAFLSRTTGKTPLKQSADWRQSRDEGAEQNWNKDVRQGQNAGKGNASPPAVWSPQASILPPSTAPLASRISVPPLAKDAPVNLHPPGFNSLSLDQQEKVLIEDILYALMGFEGQYIRFASAYNPLDEKLRLQGPQYRVAHGLDPSLRDLALSLLKIATHYAAVEAFVEVQSREECGSVNHALCAAMRKMLKDYLILIAQLEHQSLTNDNFTLHQMNLHTRPTAHMMLQLYTVAHEILRENSMLDSPDLDLDKSEDELENILESLREGRDGGRKVCKGGAVMALLSNRLAAMSGDPAARELLTLLLREASKPYMGMLNEWLHHGNVRDPHNEFLIREQKSIRREGLERDYTDEYWEKRYTIRQDLVPPQLSSLQDKVLLAGKYLNVVRECGGVENKDVDLSNSNAVPHSFDDPRFAENVSSAYAFANSALLTLLLTTHCLPARLRSLKHYFFLDRSDFFSYFLELSHSELRKPAKNVNTGKLQSLLEIVLRQPGSVAAEDPFKEDVKVVMNEVGLTGWLMRVVNVQGMDADATNLSTYTPAPTESGRDGKDKDISGYDALTFDYAVPFPLSLVVSRVTLTRYQLLFRYLLSLRHLENLLTNSWVEHSKVPAWIRKRKGAERRVELWKRRAWCLRSRMLCFVQQLLYFCTSEVIEPNWAGFMNRLKDQEDDSKDIRSATQTRPASAFTGSVNQPEPAATITLPLTQESPKVKRTVDELMQDHVDFLATCLKECMLTNSKLLRINAKVMGTCTMFANYTASLSRYLAAADPPSDPTSTTTPTPAPDVAKLDKLFDILEQYELHFSRHLKILLDALNYLAATETVVFLGLCARLSMANEGGASGGSGPSSYGGYV